MSVLRLSQLIMTLNGHRIDCGTVLNWGQTEMEGFLVQKWIVSGIVTVACLFGIYLLVYDMPNKENAAVPSESVSIPDTPVDADAAMQIYRSNCLSCHGDQLSGGFGPNLTNVGATMDKETIYKQISQGGGGMPKFESKLTEDELITLTNWLAGKKGD